LWIKPDHYQPNHGNKYPKEYKHPAQDYFFLHQAENAEDDKELGEDE